MTSLLERFKLIKPVDFEEVESGHEVIVTNEKTIIRVDDISLINDMPELFSLAKLGERDPLLATFFCQKNYTEKEGRYFAMFHRLCQPLQDAWAWKTMRRTVPDIYNREISELLEMWKAVQESMQRLTSTDEVQRQVLGMFAILYENEDNKVDIQLKIDEANRDVWEDYIRALKKFTRMEPGVNFYIRLAEIVHSPYHVSIETDTDGFRYYNIKDGGK